jgi:dTDP-4-dehydrorhamnose 3,5-epimerase
MLRDFVFEPGPIAGLVLIQPKLAEDERGFFLEDYNRQVFADHGINVEFVQDNHSRSTQGVLRGLHFQREPMAQDKLVRVVSGEVYDVAVDIRVGSPSFGQWFGLRLSAENKQMVFVPRGFAHGFQVLSPSVDFLYKVSNYYSPEHDGGILWNDPDLGIDWPISAPILSAKDQQHPRLKEL